MASVAVDTAGAADASHRVAIPYLARPTADELVLPAHDEAARHGVSLVNQATDNREPHNSGHGQHGQPLIR